MKNDLKAIIMSCSRLLMGKGGWIMRLGKGGGGRKRKDDCGRGRRNVEEGGDVWRREV